MVNVDSEGVNTRHSFDPAAYHSSSFIPAFLPQRFPSKKNSLFLPGVGVGRRAPTLVRPPPYLLFPSTLIIYGTAMHKHFETFKFVLIFIAYTHSTHYVISRRPGVAASLSPYKLKLITILCITASRLHTGSVRGEMISRKQVKQGLPTSERSRFVEAAKEIPASH